MDRLVDHLFVFEGEGKIRDFPGNYSQYREEQIRNAKDKEGGTLQTGTSLTQTEPPATTTAIAEKNQPAKRQLSYKEKREFELLEKEIPELNREKEMITGKMNSGDTAFEELQALSLRFTEIGRLLDEKEMRWLELSELQ